MTFDFFYCIGNLRDQLRFKFEFVHSKKRILCCTFLCLKTFLHFWRTSLRNTLTVLVPSFLMCKVMFIMNWEMFEMLHHPWQSVFKRAFQKYVPVTQGTPKPSNLKGYIYYTNMEFSGTYIQLWHPVTFMPLDIQGHVLPYCTKLVWKQTLKGVAFPLKYLPATERLFVLTYWCLRFERKIITARFLSLLMGAFLVLW